MAPLPQNNTDRVFFDYISGNLGTSKEHTCAVRVNSALVDAPTAQSLFLNLLNAYGTANFREGWRVVRVRFQTAGTLFSTPLALAGALASFAGSRVLPTYIGRFEAVQDNWVGRSATTGRRASLSLYRASSDADVTFRTARGTSDFPLIVANVLDVLAANAAQGWGLTIDATIPVWYQYLNGNYNSYWESELRT